jgi:hypothetical protein
MQSWQCLISSFFSEAIAGREADVAACGFIA